MIWFLYKTKTLKMKQLKKHLLAALLISFSSMAYSEYKVYSAPQNNNSGKVIELPEPTILCEDSFDPTNQNIYRYEIKEKKGIDIRNGSVNYRNYYYYNLIKYDGEIYQNINNGLTYLDPKAFNGEVITHDGNDYIIEQKELIHSYSTDWILSTWSTYSESYRKHHYKYYSFCLKAI